ncbi:MAG TPA: hypothetical protein VJ487_09550 [Alphaproteobacteria bacterium]|nr:hypothetical protein [Alphaproteobacteria bacterium]
MYQLAVDVEEGQPARDRSRLKKAVLWVSLASAGLLVILVSIGFFLDYQLSRARDSFIYGCEVAQVDYDRCDMLADAYGYPGSIPRLVRFWYVKHSLQPVVPHLGK